MTTAASDVPHSVMASSCGQPRLRHYSSVAFVWPTKCLLGGGPRSKCSALPAHVGSACLVRVRCCTGGRQGDEMKVVSCR